MNEQQAACGYSWPDRNSIRSHVCIQRGLHAHHCGVCGPDCTPPAEQQGSDKSSEGLTEAERVALGGLLFDIAKHYDWPSDMADCFLRSGWLADRVQQAEAEGAARALREAADQLDRDGMKRLGAHTVRQWLRARAALDGTQ